MENNRKRKKNDILSKYRKKRSLEPIECQELLDDLTDISDSDESFSSDSDSESESELGTSDDSDNDNSESGVNLNDNAWNRNNTMPNINNFTGESGIKVDIPETPLGFLQLFVTRELLGYFTKHTNLYANKRREQNPNMYKRWYKASIIDIAKYLGITILFGISKLPRISMYWGKEEEYHNSAVSNCMRYNRFRSLNCFFHSHGNASDTDNQDRLFKIRPVIDYLIRLFKSTYTPTQNLTIDEGMLAFKGRLSFKCYLPNKPIKYGIKLYILAESDTGYESNFKIYSGAGNTTSEMVYDLMKDYRNKNYHLYMDNFYNSVNLSEKLLKDNIYTCGTLRIVRGAPKYFQASLEQLRKGDVNFCRKGDDSMER